MNLEGRVPRKIPVLVWYDESRDFYDVNFEYRVHRKILLRVWYYVR